MPEISIKLLGITLDSAFKKAVLFADAKCERMAEKYLDRFSSYNLKPTQISLRHGDQLYNQQYADPEKGIVSGGRIANVQCECWTNPIRLMVERSVSFPGCLFLGWNTGFNGEKISVEVFNSLRDAAERSLFSVGLTISKPKQS